MAARFRQDYTGEFVLTEIRIHENATSQRREWIPNVIANDIISPRAAVIGSDVIKSQFDHRHLEDHRGGLHGTKRLQTYGTGEIWQDLRLDFYVSTNRQQIAALAGKDYHQRSVVMTTASICMAHPGDFYLIPYQPLLDDLALAVYLAAFDQHTEIFLVGYNIETPSGSKSWVQDIDHVIKQYPEAQFVLLGAEAGMPDVWRENPNVSCMKPRQFVSYCDV